MKPSEYFGEGAWNLPRRLDPLSTLMWRVERDPMLRSGLVLVMLLDRPPDPKRFAAGHEWASRMVPRLRERPVAPLLTPSMPLWAPDPEFDVGRHVRRAALPRPAGRAELLELAESLAATPFDMQRPPWESVLVEELHCEPEGHRAAWLVRFHHCLADGNLVGFWLGTLLGRAREARKDKPQPPAPPRWLETVPEQLVGPLADEAAPAAGRLARGVFSAARKPVSTTLGVAGATRRLLDVATRPAGRPSPLLRARGTTRRLASITIDRDKLRAAAQAEAVSGNVVYTAALLTGLRRYHEAHNVRVPSVSAATTLPREPNGPRTGNRFNGGKFVGPLDENDPRKLYRMLEYRLARAAPFTPAALDAVLSCVTKLPMPALLHLARSLGRSHDIQISQALALGRDSYVSGARIEQTLCFAPAPGCAVMALLFSSGSQGTLGLTLDTTAIPDPDVFVHCIEEGFADVGLPRPS